MTSIRHWSIKERAQNLRREGLSYSEIGQKLNTSKSNISGWCSEIRLTEKQLVRLRSKRGDYLAGIKVIQNKFQSDRDTAFNNGVEMYKKQKSDPRFIAGLSLYWAEGTKTKGVAVSNSDPRLILFMARWFEDYLGFSNKDLKLHIHMHSGQNEQKIKHFWQQLLNISESQFIKSFVKPEGSGFKKNLLYNGTVKMRICSKGSTIALFKVFGAISGFINEQTGGKVGLDTWIPKLQYAE